MKSTLVSKENNEVKFTMEFSAEEFNSACDKAYKANRNKFAVDGFRRGKAPRSIIEKKFGEGIFFEDAINDLVSNNYAVALDELELEVIDMPNSEFSEIAKGEGFTVTITVKCYPEIEIKDYKGVEIEKVSSEVTDEDVEAELKLKAEQNGRMVNVERAAQDGDTVIFDYEGWSEGVQFEGGTAERQPLKLGSGMFIPGFEEQLVGVAPGESKDVTVTFPEQYHSEDLAGKEAVFKCTVHEVKEMEIPEIDDEFVKDISEFDNLEALKADIRRGLELSAVSKADNDMKNSVIEKVYEANEFEVPEVMVAGEVENTLKDMDRQLQAQGMNLEMYCQYMGEDMNTFAEGLKDEAFKKVKTRMIIRAVAEQENLTASPEDIDAEIESMAKQYGLEADKLKEMLGVENLAMVANDVKMRKAVNFLFDNAVIK